MRRQFARVLFGNRQDKRSAYFRQPLRQRVAMSFGGTRVSKRSSAIRPAPPITNSTLRPQHNGRHIGSTATEAGCVLQPR
jgi:hypothetical protein